MLRYANRCVRLSVLTPSTRFTVQGIIIVLFFRCMSTLLNPVHHRGRGIKWVLMGHTVAMFSLATGYTAVPSDLQSISYIDNRKFPGFPFPDSPLGTSSTPNEGIVIVAQVSNVGHSLSSIAAMFFMP